MDQGIKDAEEPAECMMLKVAGGGPLKQNMLSY
jgi:hypothetical protein